MTEFSVVFPSLFGKHERTTNRRHLFYSLQWVWQRIHRTDQHQFGTRSKEHQKAVFFCKKENSALSEHTCLTNHTIGWDNSKIINTNRRYHQRLCLEAWHINSAHTLLYIVTMAVCCLTPIYTLPEKRPLISDHIKDLLLQRLDHPWWRHQTGV